MSTPPLSCPTRLSPSLQFTESPQPSPFDPTNLCLRPAPRLVPVTACQPGTRISVSRLLGEDQQRSRPRQDRPMRPRHVERFHVGLCWRGRQNSAGVSLIAGGAPFTVSVLLSRCQSLGHDLWRVVLSRPSGSAELTFVLNSALLARVHSPMSSPDVSGSSVPSRAILQTQRSAGAATSQSVEAVEGATTTGNNN